MTGWSDIELPFRMERLPKDDIGRPVPWFVAWIDGKPDFRIADLSKLRLAVKDGLCWVCGLPLSRFKAFPIGPMCAVNRVTAEPPSHLDCATYSGPVPACDTSGGAGVDRLGDAGTAGHDRGGRTRGGPTGPHPVRRDASAAAGMSAPTIAPDLISLEMLLAEPERPCEWAERNAASPCPKAAEWIAAGHCRSDPHAALLCSPHKTELLRILSEGYSLTCRHGNQSFVDEVRPV